MTSGICLWLPGSLIGALVGEGLFVEVMFRDKSTGVQSLQQQSPRPMFQLVAKLNKKAIRLEILLRKVL